MIIQRIIAEKLQGPHRGKIWALIFHQCAMITREKSARAYEFPRRILPKLVLYYPKTLSPSPET
jgi:hypothetical protein